MPAVPIANATTTIDRLEREFETRKERELAAARTSGASATADPSPRTTAPKPGRNDDCFCGSGKKYKKCHGANA